MSKLEISILGLLASVVFFSCGSDSSETASNTDLDPGLEPVQGGSGGTDQQTGGHAGTSGGAGVSGMAGSGASGGSAASGGSGGSGGTGGSTEDAGPDVMPDADFVYDAPVDDSSLNPDTACGNTTVEVTKTPLDMYIMFDRSGSMVEPGWSWSPLGPGTISITGGDCDYVPNGSAINSRWCYSVYALAGYFNSSSAAGNRVALQFFSLDGFASDQASCNSPNGSPYATPKVDYQTLPGGAQTLINALNAEKPLGAFTPTKAALHGLVGFTGKSPASGRITIALLVTDGKPTGCSNSEASTLGNIAANHLAQTGIRTFMIGMTGADYGILETMAKPGGAPVHSKYCPSGYNSCYSYDVGQGNTKVFEEVLNEIQKTAIGCTYSLPKASGIVDPNQIIVQYTPGGGAPIELDKRPNKAACSSDDWYYDNNDPPNIILCPNLCKEVEADMNAKIDILVGCEGS